MSHLYSAIIAISILGMVGAYSATIHRRPPPVVAQASSFRDAWNEDAAKIAVAVVVPPVPRPPAPAPARIEEPPLPSIITDGFSEERVKKLARKRHSGRGDLCSRHHLRKVHYGRTWRCRPSSSPASAGRSGR